MFCCHSCINSRNFGHFFALYNTIEIHRIQDDLRNVQQNQKLLIEKEVLLGTEYVNQEILNLKNKRNISFGMTVYLFATLYEKLIQNK